MNGLPTVNRLRWAELSSTQNPNRLYMGLHQTPPNPIRPLPSARSLHEREKPPDKPLHAHRVLAGKGSLSQQVCSRSRETNLIRSCAVRSHHIGASSETDFRLALGPGILQFPSVLCKVLPRSMFPQQTSTFSFYSIVSYKHFARTTSPL